MWWRNYADGSRWGRSRPYMVGRPADATAGPAGLDGVGQVGAEGGHGALSVRTSARCRGTRGPPEHTGHRTQRLPSTRLCNRRPRSPAAGHFLPSSAASWVFLAFLHSIMRRDDSSMPIMPLPMKYSSFQRSSLNLVAELKFHCQWATGFVFSAERHEGCGLDLFPRRHRSLGELTARSMQYRRP